MENKKEQKGTIYCVEVDRCGIGEESMVLHYEFNNPPTRAEIENKLMDEDCGYDKNYCDFNYYPI